jgi:hypothetical protein
MEKKLVLMSCLYSLGIVYASVKSLKEPIKYKDWRYA